MVLLEKPGEPCRLSGCLFWIQFNYGDIVDLGVLVDRGVLDGVGVIVGVGV